MLKFWEHIKKRLENRQNLYFAGGTLFIDHEQKSGGIALNLDGQGFVFSNPYPFLKNWNGKLYCPINILQLVRKIYVEAKGETEFYKEKINQKD